MEPTRLALPRLDTWSEHAQIQAFFRVLVPHWDGFSDVILDLRSCTFMSAEGAAVLATFKLNRDKLWGTTGIDWATVSIPVARQMDRWGLSPLFGRYEYERPGTAIPPFHRTELDMARLDEYICSQVCTACNMPAMTADLHDEVQRALIELFQNVFYHAASPCCGIAVGQFYPLAKQVQVCVCDSGLGLVQQIRRAGLAQGTPPDTLEWAMGSGNTTRRQEHDTPGGLGLYMLREFVKINEGSLRIVANEGYLCQNGRDLIRRTLSVAFPGTLFQVKFNVRSDREYRFASE